MLPYYQDEAITIYHGDAREILPSLEGQAIITDPTWPNAAPKLFGFDNPERMLREILELRPASILRLVIHLGCDSDPRFLLAVPPEIPFFRVAHLQYTRPHYKGRLLYESDIAYFFGTPPASEKGRHVIPGRVTAVNNRGKESTHPTPRKIEHVRWLVK